MKKLHVDVWSDVVCPWCYIGKRRLEAALAKFPHRSDVELVWRAFELDPSAPKVAVGDHAERIAKKYGRSREQIAEMTRNITSLAAVEGLDFQLEASRSGNTFDAHRVLHLAGERGKQDAVKERFFKGYMTEKEAIGDPEVLIRLAAEAGLDADEVRAVLASDRYAKEVREEEHRPAAQDHGGAILRARRTDRGLWGPVGRRPAPRARRGMVEDGRPGRRAVRRRCRLRARGVRLAHDASPTDSAADPLFRDYRSPLDA